jgi:hypothetical protein
MNLDVPYNFGNFSCSCGTGGFSTSTQPHAVQSLSGVKQLLFFSFATSLEIFKPM